MAARTQDVAFAQKATNWWLDFRKVPLAEQTTQVLKTTQFNLENDTYVLATALLAASVAWTVFASFSLVIVGIGVGSFYVRSHLEPRLLQYRSPVGETEPKSMWEWLSAKPLPKQKQPTDEEIANNIYVHLGILKSEDLKKKSKEAIQTEITNKVAQRWKKDWVIWDKITVAKYRVVLKGAPEAAKGFIPDRFIQLFA